MKQLLLAALLGTLLLGCSSLTPPPAGLNVPTPEDRLDMLNERLHLTTEQMDAMRPILQEEFEENTYRVESLSKKDGNYRKAAERRIREEFQVREEITRDAFSTILTPEQLVEYDALMAEMKAEHGPMGDEPPDGGPSGGKGGKGGSGPPPRR